MTKRSSDDASEHLRKFWLAYEYPGQIVLRDLARLGRMIKRTYATFGRDRRLAEQKERESHLWAERRE